MKYSCPSLTEAFLLPPEVSRASVETYGIGSSEGGLRSSHTMSAAVCGLDVHKDSTYATILNPEGKICFSISFYTRFPKQEPAEWSKHSKKL
jgi:hypothetical protein